MGGLFHSPKIARAGLAAALLFGAVLRLLWHDDIEYKADQVWTFLRVQEFWATGAIPTIGMTSSVGPPNPALSPWVFIALSAFVPVDTPLPLTRAVEVVNVAALLMLLAFVRRCVHPVEREPWLWATALVAVNPFAIHFSRCIWQMNLLPPLLVGMVWAWWFRSRAAGAFLWGLIGACLGQIHMPGFFFAGAFFLVTAWLDRRSVHWRAWFAGSVLGALPLIPWVIAIAHAPPHVSAWGRDYLNLAFMQHWLNMASGVGLKYNLGNDFDNFIGPWSGYGVAVLIAAIVALMLAVAVRFGARMVAERSAVCPVYFNLRSPTFLVLTSAMFGYGLFLLTLLRPIYLHYFVIAFCLPALSLAWFAFAGTRSTERSLTVTRALLTGLVIAQGTLALAFHGYIHDRAVIDGDYGTVYRDLPADRSSRPET